MLCERCQKNNASVHMTQIINGNKVEKHLCEECAIGVGLDSPISFQDIFQGLLNLTGSTPKAWTEECNVESVYKCSACGLTFEGFRKTGKLGCASCYKAFKPQLDSTLKSIHGSNIHKGKFPHKSGGMVLVRREKEELKKKLLTAIANEEFEEAAKIRDEIRKLEKEV